jgi:uncharacterized protein (UPF0332 family)
MRLKKFKWQVWMRNPDKCKKDFKNYIKNGLLKVEIEKENLKKSHLSKADYNLDFINFLSEKKVFYDWIIVGCYYAIYRASLALIASKGFSSKKHMPTLCAVICLFYFPMNGRLLNEEDIEIIIKSFLNKEEVGYFAEAKRKRETAAYGINEEFTKRESEDLKDKTISFVNKVKSLLE